MARAMLEDVFQVADAAGLPVRLVSSLMNLDSFSLYTKMGFVPGTVFQDLQFPPACCLRRCRRPAPSVPRPWRMFRLWWRWSRL